MVDLVVKLLLFIAGFVLIYFAVDWFLDNVKEIVEKKNISPYTMGAILLGVDVEEVIASVTAAVLGYSTVAVGNAIGNNTISMTLPLAIPAIFFAYKVMKPPKPFVTTVIALMAVQVFAMAITSIFPRSFFVAGMFTIGIYTCLLAYNVAVVRQRTRSTPKEQLDHALLGLVEMESDDDDDPMKRYDERGSRSKDAEHVDRASPEVNVKKRVVIIGISLVAMIAGSYCLSQGLDGIIEGIGLSQHLTGYVIVALGVNVEEFMLIYKSVKKKVPEVGVGGVIMKTAWNLGITYGLSVLISPAVPVTQSLIINTTLIAIAFVFLAGILQFETISRKSGVVFLGIFISYMLLNILFVTS